MISRRAPIAATIVGIVFTLVGCKPDYEGIARAEVSKGVAACCIDRSSSEQGGPDTRQQCLDEAKTRCAFLDNATIASSKITSTCAGTCGVVEVKTSGPQGNGVCTMMVMNNGRIDNGGCHKE